MRRLMAAVLMMVAALLPAGTVAQSPAPPTMPWAEYLAAAQAFTDSLTPEASQAPFTLDGFKASVHERLAVWQDEYDRLAAVVPEPCYADAHAAYLSFRHDELANYRDAVPMLDAAESQMGIIGIALMVQGILAQAHPLAFPEPSPGSDTISMGPVLDALNILDTLQTCIAAPSPA